MNGVQCDTCRFFAADPSGWFMVAQQQPSLSPLAAMLGGGGRAELDGTFCTVRCLAEWAYAKTVISETKSTGTGWPG